MKFTCSYLLPSNKVGEKLKLLNKYTVRSKGALLLHIIKYFRVGVIVVRLQQENRMHLCKVFFKIFLCK